MKESYTIPEKREIEQILVSDKEKAEKIIKTLEKEKDFIKVAKNMAEQNKEDTNLGLVTVDSLIPEIADATFDAKKGEIVGPIESYLGFHIIKVKDIIKGKTIPFSEKQKELTEIAKNEKISEVINGILEKIDDAFGLGKTLEDTAKEVNGKVIVLDDIDITGTKRDGKKSDYNFVTTDFLNNLYAADMEVGQISVTMENNDGISVFRLDRINAPAIKDFTEVKDELFKLWEANKKQELLDEKVAAVSNDIDDGISFAKLTAKYKVNSKDINKAGRVSLTNDISKDVIDTLFRIKQDGEILKGQTKNGFAFVTLTKVIAPNKANEDIGLDQVKDDLNAEIAESLYSEFMNVLGKRYKLIVNEVGVEKALESYKGKLY